VRYHGFFPGYEIGSVDTEAARRATDVHLAALEAMQGRGEQVITIHIGLQWKDPIDDGRAVENLSRLVDRARALGITVCVENLRRGPASDPKRVLSWADRSGAMMTLDVGHAASCQCVQDGELTVVDFVDLFANRLLEVHMYERESDRHYPPQDMRVLGPIVDRLLDTPCTWWTLELEEYAEALATRTLLLDYLAQKS
jgi:sugar phosphate isomerase/epimerase